MEIKPQFETVMSRAKEALGAASYADLGRMLGLSTSAYANRKRGDSIPYDVLLPLAHSRNVSLDWLIFGEGSSRKDPEERVRLIPEIDGKLLASIVVELNKAFAHGSLSAEQLTDSAQRALLASLIYNRVAEIPEGMARAAAVKSKVADFAHAARIMTGSTGEGA